MKKSKIILLSTCAIALTVAFAITAGANDGKSSFKSFDKNKITTQKNEHKKQADVIKSDKTSQQDKKQAFDKFKENSEKRIEELELSQPKNQKEQDEKTQEERTLKQDMFEVAKAYQATLPPVDEIVKIKQRIADTEELNNELYTIFSAKYSGLQENVPGILKRKEGLQKIKQKFESGEITTMNAYEDAMRAVDDEIAKDLAKN